MPLVYRFKIILVVFSALVFFQCKKDKPMFTAIQKIKLGNLIDDRMDQLMSAKYIDSASFPEAYNLILSNLNKLQPSLQNFFNFYNPRFRVFNDSAKLMFTSPNGKIYMSTGILRTLQTFDELQAIMCHCLHHVDNYDIITVIDRKYGVNAFEAAYYSRDLGKLPDIENTIINATFDSDMERESDDYCNTVMKSMSQDKALALAYINLYFSFHQQDTDFFLSHHNYDNRIYNLLLNTSSNGADYRAKIADYEKFLKLIP